MLAMIGSSLVTSWVCGARRRARRLVAALEARDVRRIVTVHVAAAGLVGGATAIGAGLAGPVWAPVIEIGGGVATAAIAAHAVWRLSRRRADLDAKRVLAIAAHDAADGHPLLAAKALRLALAPRRRTARDAGLALASIGARAAAAGIVEHTLLAALPPLAAGAGVLGASRAAWRSARFVHHVERAALRAAA